MTRAERKAIIRKCRASEREHVAQTELGDALRLEVLAEERAAGLPPLRGDPDYEEFTMKKSKLTEKSAIAIAKKGLTELRDELQLSQDREQATAAQDPIAALFTGIRFRKSTDGLALMDRFRQYWAMTSANDVRQQQNMYNAQIREHVQHIRRLEAAIRRSKRLNAEDVLAALDSARQADFEGQVMGVERG